MENLKGYKVIKTKRIKLLQINKKHKKLVKWSVAFMCYGECSTWLDPHISPCRSSEHPSNSLMCLLLQSLLCHLLYVWLHVKEEVIYNVRVDMAENMNLATAVLVKLKATGHQNENNLVFKKMLMSSMNNKPWVRCFLWEFLKGRETYHCSKWRSFLCYSFFRSICRCTDSQEAAPHSAVGHEDCLAVQYSSF